MGIEATPLGQARYTDAEAVAAIEAATLALTDDLTIEKSAPQFFLKDTSQAANSQLLTFQRSGGGWVVTFDNDNLTTRVEVFRVALATGVVTFTSIPLLPASDPTLDEQVARKAYVDTEVAVGAAKAFATVAADGTLQANSHNIASVVKNSTGNYTVSFDTNFANSNYVVVVTVEASVGGAITAIVENPAVGSIDVETRDASSTVQDSAFHLVAFGGQ